MASMKLTKNEIRWIVRMREENMDKLSKLEREIQDLYAVIASKEEEILIAKMTIEGALFELEDKKKELEAIVGKR